MLLAIDIGNTNITAGVFAPNGRLKAHWRLATDKKRTADEYGVLLSSLITSAGLKKKITGAMLASVVPALNPALKKAVQDYLNIKPLMAGEDVPIPVKTLVDRPQEVGADRLINALSAYHAYRTSLIVVDFGTAITFDCVTKDGEFAGGAIAPGIGISLNALSRKAAKLPVVEFAKSDKITGKNTADAMRAGAYFGFASLTDGVIKLIKKENDPNARVIATGGMSGVIAKGSRQIDEIDEFLTLKGLNILYSKKR